MVYLYSKTASSIDNVIPSVRNAVARHDKEKKEKKTKRQFQSWIVLLFVKLVSVTNTRVMKEILWENFIICSLRQWLKLIQNTRQNETLNK